MDYNDLRHAADSWGLLYMVLIFIGVVLFAFRPGSKKVYEDVANIPLKEDELDGR